MSFHREPTSPGLLLVCSDSEWPFDEQRAEVQRLCFWEEIDELTVDSDGNSYCDLSASIRDFDRILIASYPSISNTSNEKNKSHFINAEWQSAFVSLLHLSSSRLINSSVLRMHAPQMPMFSAYLGVLESLGCRVAWVSTIEENPVSTFSLVTRISMMRKGEENISSILGTSRWNSSSIAKFFIKIKADFVIFETKIMSNFILLKGIYFYPTKKMPLPIWKELIEYYA